MIVIVQVNDKVRCKLWWQSQAVARWMLDYRREHRDRYPGTDFL